MEKKLNQIIKENQDLYELGKYGKNLIDTFKKQNQKKENMFKENEQKLWQYKHSKPPVLWNQWLPFNHIKE